MSRNRRQYFGNPLQFSRRRFIDETTEPFTIHRRRILDERLVKRITCRRIVTSFVEPLTFFLPAPRKKTTPAASFHHHTTRRKLQNAPSISLEMSTTHHYPEIFALFSVNPEDQRCHARLIPSVDNDPLHSHTPRNRVIKFTQIALRACHSPNPEPK